MGNIGTTDILSYTGSDKALQVGVTYPVMETGYNGGVLNAIQSEGQCRTTATGFTFLTPVQKIVDYQGLKYVVAETRGILPAITYTAFEIDLTQNTPTLLYDKFKAQLGGYNTTSAPMAFWNKYEYEIVGIIVVVIIIAVVVTLARRKR